MAFVVEEIASQPQCWRRAAEAFPASEFPGARHYDHIVALTRFATTALKCREAAQLWTEAYPAMELRHGPISVLDEQSAVWILGAAPAGLIDDVRATGASVVTFEQEDPMVALIRAQSTAMAIAVRRGLDPDRPRNLSRAVELPGPS